MVKPKSKIFLLFEFMVFILFFTLADYNSNAEGVKNPLLLTETREPFVTNYDDNYYMLVTTGDIKLRMSKSIEGLKTAKATKVWSPQGEIKGAVWAPEIHKIDGKWYIYASGSIEFDRLNMRLFVLESSGDDPMGPYYFKGLLDRNLPAIDPTYFAGDDDKGYLLWSQFDYENQNIYIGELESPDKLGKVRTKISSPKYEWEKKDSSINEGPQILKDDKKTFVIFSANSCRSPDYSMGFLSNTDGNYLLATSWKKSVVPLFQKSDKNKVYGPGQATFIKSPDMKDYFVYQAKTTSEITNTDICTRIQSFSWDSNGNPFLGEPVGDDVLIVLSENSTEETQLVEGIRRMTSTGTTSEKVNNISNSIGRGEAKFVTIGEIMLSSSGDEVANVLTSENEEPNLPREEKTSLVQLLGACVSVITALSLLYYFKSRG